jgi:hypothetical protein
VRQWQELTNQMKKVLRDKGWARENGKIIKI